LAVKKTINKRVFGKATNLMHDLYKLSVGKAIRYIGWTEGGEHRNPKGYDGKQAFDQSNWTHIEHCHFFHTIDTRGSEQVTSTTINGHWHDMELVTPATSDSPAVYKCSGPKKVVMDRIHGQLVKRVIDVPFDDHSHDVEYLKSQILQPRSISAEAAQAAAKFVATTTLPEPTPVAGIA
jgi:hypothetical protein